MMTIDIPTTSFGKYHFGGGGAVGSGTVQVTKSQLAKIPCLVPTKNWFGLHSLLLIVTEHTGKQLIITLKSASFSLCCRRQGRWLSGMLGLLCVFICMHARVILLGFLQTISNSLLHKVPGFGDRQLQPNPVLSTCVSETFWFAIVLWCTLSKRHNPFNDTYGIAPRNHKAGNGRPATRHIFDPIIREVATFCCGACIEGACQENAEYSASSQSLELLVKCQLCVINQQFVLISSHASARGQCSDTLVRRYIILCTYDTAGALRCVCMACSACRFILNCSTII